MAITAAQVKELREMTGAGMMDCKKALTATEGDMDKAVEFLQRERSCYRSEESKPYCSRGSLQDDLLLTMLRTQLLLRLTAETDFVAKNEKFQQYVADVAASGSDNYSSRYRCFPGRGMGTRYQLRL